MSEGGLGAALVFIVARKNRTRGQARTSCRWKIT
jgi:hypothetical protein